MGLGESAVGYDPARTKQALGDLTSIDTGNVYIDVSGLKEGGDGSKIYNIAATYAHNTGRILIGDPNGLSDVAMRRRTEHKLSSALKFGTTRHLAPHLRQVMGARDIGVPPMRDILAVTIVTGFFGILVAMMVGVLTVSDQQALLILLGSLSAGFGAVLNFFFGSSRGSQNKDVLLAGSIPPK